MAEQLWLADYPLVAYATAGELRGMYVVLDPFREMNGDLSSKWDCTVVDLERTEVENFVVGRQKSETSALLVASELDIAPRDLQPLVLEYFFNRASLTDIGVSTQNLKPWWRSLVESG